MSAALFREAIGSVVRLTYHNLEIIVLDNSNSDEVERVVTDLRDGRIHYQRNQPCLRDNIVINHRKAFQPRNGQYHIVPSSDCVLAENALERMDMNTMAAWISPCARIESAWSTMS